MKATVEPVKGLFGHFINQVTFHDFNTYSKKVKEWIRLTGRVRFIQLLWLAQALNKGITPEEAIRDIIRNHG